MIAVSRESASQRTVEVCALIAGGMALVSAALWLAGGWKMLTFGGQYVPSAPMTSWLLVLLNAALFLLSRQPDSLPVRIFAGAVAWSAAVAGGLVISRLWIPAIPPFELVVAPGRPVVQGVSVGLMSPYTGGVFVAAAGGLLIPLSSRLRPAPRILAAHFGIVAGITALVSLAGQIVGGGLLAASTVKPMSLPTSVLFVITAVGLVTWAQPDLFAKVRPPAPPRALASSGARTMRRVATAVVLILIGVLAVTGVAFLRREIADLRENQERSLDGIARMKAAEVAHWRQERLEDGDWLAHALVADQIVADLEDAETSASARVTATNWLGPLLEGGEYDLAAIYGRDRRKLFELPDTPGAPCPHLMAALSADLRPGQPILTDLHAEPGRPESAGLGLIVPLADRVAATGVPRAMPKAYVVLHADADRRLFPATLAWPGLTETGEIFLVRRDGDAALVLSRLRHYPGPGFRLRIPMSATEKPAIRALLGRMDPDEGIDYRGAAVLAAASPIAGSNWVLLAKVDRREIYGLVRERAWMVGVSLVLMSVGVALGLSLVHRRRDAIALERELAERRRRQDAEQNFQMLFRQMLDAFALHEIVCDGRGKPIDYRFLAVNPAFELLTGLKAEQIVGRTVLDVLPGIETWWIDTYGQVALTGKPAHFEHFSSELGRHYSVTAFSPAYGQFVALFTDTTERLQTQALLVQAEKMRSVAGLAAGVAHEINNPLGVVAQAADNIERRVFGDLPGNQLAAQEVGIDLADLRAYLDRRDIRAFLTDIREATGRATRIVANMLEFSRRADSERTPADLAALFDRALTLAMTDLDLRKRCDLRHVRITRDIAPDVPPVPVVAVEIEQVLLNLIVNAAQSMADLPVDTAPQLDVRVFSDAGFAAVQIGDNGPGMTAEVRQRVFEPFFTTKAPGRGTGLGLAVAYAIVTQHHKGRIDVASAPGEGARITVRLPLLMEGTAPGEEIRHG